MPGESDAVLLGKTGEPLYSLGTLSANAQDNVAIYVMLRNAQAEIRVLDTDYLPFKVSGSPAPPGVDDEAEGPRGVQSGSG